MTNSGKGHYIHGTHEKEQQRLAKLNALTNSSFIEFVQVQESDRILELGSGLGILAEMISQKLTTGQVTGIEISPDQLAKCPHKTGRLDFVLGDAHKLPFEDNCFDTVYCRYILEHVREPLLVLGEAIRVLKPGGRIFIQENSVLLLEFYPDCPRFKKVWKTFADYQAGIGGDAMIGIRLYEMLKQTGFVNPELSMAPEIHYQEKGTLVPWIDNLIVILQGAKDQLIQNGYVTSMQFTEAHQELEDFKNNEFASSYFYWNRAKALKLPLSL